MISLQKSAGYKRNNLLYNKVIKKRKSVLKKKINYLKTGALSTYT